LGDGYAFDVFAAAVIGGVSLQGGKGNLLGALAGVLLLGSITNALNLANVSPYHISIIRGLIILFAVVIDTIKNRFLD
jgi:ribose/xylose/arabinose/galactoside ABC-type transport system permease subunit